MIKSQGQALWLRFAVTISNGAAFLQARNHWSGLLLGAEAVRCAVTPLRWPRVQAAATAGDRVHVGALCCSGNDLGMDLVHASSVARPMSGVPKLHNSFCFGLQQHNLL